MRNLKKLTAILLVSAMCIGTAFTSFASETAPVADAGSENGNGGTEGTTPTPNPGQEEVAAPVTVEGNAVDKDGNEIPTTVTDITDEKVIETLTSEEALKDILGSKYQIGSKDTVTVLAAGEIDIVGDMPAGGVDITMVIVDGDVKPGNTVYVLHQKADGTWEVFEAVVDETGRIKVHFDSLSPVAVVKVMSDGTVKVLKDKPATSEKKSPKTGA